MDEKCKFQVNRRYIVESASPKTFHNFSVIHYYIVNLWEFYVC